MASLVTIFQLAKVPSFPQKANAGHSQWIKVDYHHSNIRNAVQSHWPIIYMCVCVTSASNSSGTCKSNVSMQGPFYFTGQYIDCLKRVKQYCDVLIMYILLPKYHCLNVSPWLSVPLLDE